MPIGRRDRLVAALMAMAIAAGACAPKRSVPPAPVAIAHGEFVYPAVPPALQGTAGADVIDIGWRYLQGDNAISAERTFAFALRRNPALYPARTGLGYVALSRRDYKGALSAFDTALKEGPAYPPALVGRGQALLALNRDHEALAAFESALTADATLTDVRRRVDVLRFRNVQDLIESAREAARKGRDADARAAYERALAASPDSAFLYRELGQLNRKGGQADRALEQFKRAADLDPSDAVSLVQMGELLEERRDYAGAESAYRKAVDIDPTPELSARLAATGKKAREARLPPEYRQALHAPQLTRGDLAAIIGVRLDELLREAEGRQVVLTDIRGHWANEWISTVARAGVMDPFENHTFQPRTGVRRGDLAAAASRLLSLIAARDPDLRSRLAQPPAIADLTARHAQYRAVAAAVASGVIPLLPGDRFEVGQPVGGAEALEVIDRVHALAARTQPAAAFE